MKRIKRNREKEGGKGGGGNKNKKRIGGKMSREKNCSRIRGTNEENDER